MLEVVLHHQTRILLDQVEAVRQIRIRIMTLVVICSNMKQIIF